MRWHIHGMSHTTTNSDGRPSREIRTTLSWKWMTIETYPYAVAGRLLALIGQDLGSNEKISVRGPSFLGRARAAIEQQDMNCWQLKDKVKYGVYTISLSQ